MDGSGGNNGNYPLGKMAMTGNFKGVIPADTNHVSDSVARFFLTQKIKTNLLLLIGRQVD